jgi:tetratricopeptide (TPR) repeat protein
MQEPNSNFLAVKRHDLLAAAILVAITVLVYLPAMRADYIWDDKEMTVDNALLKSDHGLHDIWLTKKLPEYHPLTYSFLWVEWRLWGTNPAGYHVLNIFLHTANVVLLWLVLRKLRIPGSWLAALLFGVHPVCVASAAWIAEIKNTLSMLLYLVAVLFYLRSEDGGEKVEPVSYAISLAAFLLALLSKVSVVVLPAVLLLVAWWRHGRISRRDLARTAPFFLLGMAAGLFGMTIQNRYTALNDPLPARLLGGSWAVWFYLWKLLWPAHLTIIYPRWNIQPASPAAWIPGLCFAAMFYLFWRRREGWGKAFLFGLGYFVIALGPVLGVFKVVFLDFSQVADHLQYLAVPGIITLVVAGGWQWLGQTKTVGLLAAVTVTAVLSVLTWQNQRHYADMPSLWQDNLAENPNSYQALIYMGADAESHGRYLQAFTMFKRGLEIRPDSLDGHYNMGIALDDLGRTDEAIAEMDKTLQINPRQADAHILMAWFLDKKGKLDEEAAHLREAIRYAPDDFRAHQNLGHLLVKQGKLDEAVSQFGEALRLNPNLPAVFVALGYAQGKRGELAAAKLCFQKALSLEPANADALKGLAALSQLQSFTPNAPPKK